MNDLNELEINDNSNQQSNTPPDNNLLWAILSTVLCCLPLGIYSIILSGKVNTLWASGDKEGAIKAAKDAKKFAFIGALVVALGIIAYLLFILVIFIVGGSYK